MKRWRFTEGQIGRTLRGQEAEMKTVEGCRKHALRAAMLHARKAKYGGIELSEAKRGTMLDSAMLKEVAR